MFTFCLSKLRYVIVNCRGEIGVFVKDAGCDLSFAAKIIKGDYLG